MSFIGDAWRNITDTGKSLWDKFHGGSNNQPTVDAVRPSDENPEAQGLPDSQKKQDEAASVAPLLPVEGPLTEAESLAHAIYLLGTEGMNYISKRSNGIMLHLEDVTKKMRALSELQQHITTKQEKDGKFNVKDDDVKALLRQAKASGVVLDEKKLDYSKDEIDALMRNIDRSIKDFDYKWNTLRNQSQQCLQDHNLLLQELKSLEDKLHQLKTRQAQAVKGG